MHPSKTRCSRSGWLAAAAGMVVAALDALPSRTQLRKFFSERRDAPISAGFSLINASLDRYIEGWGGRTPWAAMAK